MSLLGLLQPSDFPSYLESTFLRVPSKGNVFYLFVYLFVLSFLILLQDILLRDDNIV